MLQPGYWDAVSALFLVVGAANGVRALKQEGSRRHVRAWLALSCVAWSICSHVVGRYGLASGAWPAAGAVGCIVVSAATVIRQAVADSGIGKPPRAR